MFSPAKKIAIPADDMPPWHGEKFTPPMIGLPAGEFVMGENAGDKFANDTERPAHRVKFSENFALGKFPVTVGEFRQFDPNHSRDGADDLPAVRISWHDAIAFCEWLSKKTNRIFRLPTESEWEFACRARTQTPFSFGDEITIADANFLYDENGLRIGIGRRATVGIYPPNKFGFHDFHGNVCEWTADNWHPNYFGAPTNGGAWIEDRSERRVIRGGAWDYLPRLLRSSWRDWRDADFRADNLGFRVATGGPKKI